MKVLIYCLKDPITNEIKYIGRTRKSLKERLQGHVHGCGDRKSNAPRTQWLRKLKTLKLKPTIELIKTIKGWKKSHLVERKTIEEYRLKDLNLLNRIDLGPGPEKNYGRHLTIYDLEGNRIKRFINVHATAEFIGISYKHLEMSLRRKAKAVKGYQISDIDYPRLGKYKKLVKQKKRINKFVFKILKIMKLLFLNLELKLEIFLNYLILHFIDYFKTIN